jgi:hypothetical protein
MLTRTAGRCLVTLAATGLLLLCMLSLAQAQAASRSASERQPGQPACKGGPMLASDASAAKGAALVRLRAEALASAEVRRLREYLSGRGYVALDAQAKVTTSSRDSVVVLPMAKQGDQRQRGAAIAYVMRADGTRTIEAATLRMAGREVKAEREYTVSGAQVVQAQSFIPCMIACVSVNCTKIVRCPTIFGPGPFLACATAVCAAQVPGCLRLCR